MANDNNFKIIKTELVWPGKRTEIKKGKFLAMM